MKNQGLKALSLVFAVLLITTGFSPAVLATPKPTQTNERLEKKINQRFEKLESNTSLQNRIYAEMILQNIVVNENPELKNKTLQLIKSANKKYRDGYRINTKKVFQNDSKALQKSTKLVGLTKKPVLNKTTYLIYLSDKQILEASITDTKSSLKRMGKELKDKQEKRARKALTKAEKSLEQAKNTVSNTDKLKKRIKQRKQAIKKLRIGWEKAQKAIDIIDKNTQPKVKITQRVDPRHNEKVTYVLEGKVFDIQPYELQDATVYVNGNKRKTFDLYNKPKNFNSSIDTYNPRSTHPTSNLSFEANISIKENKNKIKVVVVDNKESIGGKLTVIEAIAGPDLKVSFKELRKAIKFWATNEPVPGTGGEKLDFFDLRKLFRMWKQDSDTDTATLKEFIVRNSDISEQELKDKKPKLVRKKSGQKAVDVLKLDGDGLPDFFEIDVAGTDPLNDDSDSDKTSGDEADNDVYDGAENFDSDGMNNYVEWFEGSSIFSSNGDNDGLPDSYEVNFSERLDPSRADSNNNSVPDGEEDFDNDSLTTMEEMEKDTEPLIGDYDGDELNDSEELKYGTNTTKDDTDSDGLTDKQEISLDTDPTKRDTDGNGVIDGRQSYTTETSNSSLGAKVKITGKGNLAKSVVIEKKPVNIYGTDSYEEFKISPVINFESDREFEKAIITISYNDSKISNESNASIFWYNRSKQVFEPVDSTVNKKENTVTAEVQHFSRYAVFNKYGYFDYDYVRGGGGSSNDREGIYKIPINDSPIKNVYDGLIIERTNLGPPSRKTNANGSVQVQLNKDFTEVTGYLNFTDAKRRGYYRPPPKTPKNSNQIYNPELLNGSQQLMQSSKVKKMSHDESSGRWVTNHSFRFSLSDSLENPIVVARYNFNGSNPAFKVNIVERKPSKKNNEKMVTDSHVTEFQDDFNDLDGWNCNTDTSSGDCKINNGEAVVYESGNTRRILKKQFHLPEKHTATLNAELIGASVDTGERVIVKVESKTSSKSETLVRLVGNERHKNWKQISKTLKEFRGKKIEVKFIVQGAGSISSPPQNGSAKSSSIPTATSNIRVDELGLSLDEPVFKQNFTGDYDWSCHDRTLYGLTPSETGSCKIKYGWAEVTAKNGATKGLENTHTQPLYSLDYGTQLDVELKVMATTHDNDSKVKVDIDEEKTIFNISGDNSTDGWKTFEKKWKFDFGPRIRIVAKDGDSTDSKSPIIRVEKIIISKNGETLIENKFREPSNKIFPANIRKTGSYASLLFDQQLVAFSAPLETGPSLNLNECSNIRLSKKINVKPSWNQTLYPRFEWVLNHDGARSEAKVRVKNPDWQDLEMVDGVKPRTIDGYKDNLHGRGIGKFEKNMDETRISFSVNGVDNCGDGLTHPTYGIDKVSLWNGLIKVENPDDKRNLPIKITGTESSSQNGPVETRENKRIWLSKEWGKPSINYRMDSDGDGIPDYNETHGIHVSPGVVVYTDPNDKDTDGDGVNDFEEIGYTDDNKVNTPDRPRVRDYYEMNSNPTKPDSDEDGLTDKQELGGAFTKIGFIDDAETARQYVSTLRTANKKDISVNVGRFFKNRTALHTSPLVADRDLDGLNDGQEWMLKTNPGSEDTDDDGLTDFMEVSDEGYDPTIFEVKPPRFLNTSVEVKPDIKEADGIPVIGTIIEGATGEEYHITTKLRDESGLKNITANRDGEKRATITDVENNEYNTFVIESKWNEVFGRLGDILKGTSVTLKIYDNHNNYNRKRVYNRGNIITMGFDLASDIAGVVLDALEAVGVDTLVNTLRDISEHVPGLDQAVDIAEGAAELARLALAGVEGLLSGIAHSLGTIPALFSSFLSNPIKFLQDIFLPIANLLGRAVSDFFGLVDLMTDSSRTAFYNIMERSNYCNPECDRDNSRFVFYAYGWLIGYIFIQIAMLVVGIGELAAISGSSRLINIIRSSSIASKFSNTQRISNILSKIGIGSRTANAIDEVKLTYRLTKNYWATNARHVSSGITNAYDRISQMGRIGRYSAGLGKFVFDQTPFKMIVNIRRINRVSDELDVDTANWREVAHVQSFVNAGGRTSVEMAEDLSSRSDLDFYDTVIDPDDIGRFDAEDLDVNNLGKYHRAMTTAYSNGDTDAVVDIARRINGDLDPRVKRELVKYLDYNPESIEMFSGDVDEDFVWTDIAIVRSEDGEFRTETFEFIARTQEDAEDFLGSLERGEVRDFIDESDVPDDIDPDKVDRMKADLVEQVSNGRITEFEADEMRGIIDESEYSKRIVDGINHDIGRLVSDTSDYKSFTETILDINDKIDNLDKALYLYSTQGARMYTILSMVAKRGGSGTSEGEAYNLNNAIVRMHDKIKGSSERVGKNVSTEFRYAMTELKEVRITEITEFWKSTGMDYIEDVDMVFKRRNSSSTEKLGVEVLHKDFSEMSLSEAKLELRAYKDAFQDIVSSTNIDKYKLVFDKRLSNELKNYLTNTLKVNWEYTNPAWNKESPNP